MIDFQSDMLPISGTHTTETTAIGITPQDLKAQLEPYRPFWSHVCLWGVQSRHYCIGEEISPSALMYQQMLIQWCDTPLLDTQIRPSMVFVTTFERDTTDICSRNTGTLRDIDT